MKKVVLCLVVVLLNTSAVFADEAKTVETLTLPNVGERLSEEEMSKISAPLSKDGKGAESIVRLLDEKSEGADKKTVTILPK